MGEERLACPQPVAPAYQNGCGAEHRPSSTLSADRSSRVISNPSERPRCLAAASSMPTHRGASGLVAVDKSARMLMKVSWAKRLSDLPVRKPAVAKVQIPRRHERA